MQKGRCKVNAMRGNQLAFGSFGIKSLDTCWITGRQIEAARVLWMYVWVKVRVT